MTVGLLKKSGKQLLKTIYNILSNPVLIILLVYDIYLLCRR